MEPLGAVLDDALAEVKQHIVAAEHDLATIVVWTAHTHLVHHEHIYIETSANLSIQSPDRGCGKSTVLDVVAPLVPRPVTGSSFTPAAIFRLCEQRQPTVLLDEADNVISERNGELVAILNSSHRRSTAFVWRCEEVGGQQVPTQFVTWAPIAFAGIKELPSTLQDRSIVVRLVKARKGERRGRLYHGKSAVLQAIKPKLIRWALDLRRLPEPEMPEELFNRARDNWEVLFAIAELAGGPWPGLMRTAAFAGIAADQKESVLVALLEGIRRAFGEQARVDTRVLIDALLSDDEYDWTAANRGKPINEAWLRERLRNVITPAADGKAGSEKWRAGRAFGRGYTRSRFGEAFERYLPCPSAPQKPPHPPHPPHGGLKPCKTTEYPVAGGGNATATNEYVYATPEGAADSEEIVAGVGGLCGGCEPTHPPQETTYENNVLDHNVADVADVAAFAGRKEEACMLPAFKGLAKPKAARRKGGKNAPPSGPVVTEPVKPPRRKRKPNGADAEPPRGFGPLGEEEAIPGGGERA